MTLTSNTAPHLQKNRRGGSPFFPRYIVFEGIDGAGKSTQLKLMAERFHGLNVTPVELCEPTYGEFGAAMRESLAQGVSLSASQQSVYFTADRKEHVRSRIRPILGLIRAGKPFVILQHRYYLSAPVYQWNGDREATRLLKAQQTIAPQPDLVLLLDVPSRTARQRILRRERRGASITEKHLDELRHRYFRFAKLLKEWVVTIDGRGSVNRVSRRLWDAVETWPNDASKRYRESLS